MWTLGLLIMLVGINGAPILARKLAPRWSTPVDCGLKLADGSQLLGKSKTWRGLASGMLAALIMGSLLGLPVWLSLTAGALSLGGDLLTSFIKRRLRYHSSAEAPVLDQFLEVTLPLILIDQYIPIGVWNIFLILVGFILINRGISPLLFRMGIRRRPY